MEERERGEDGGKKVTSLVEDLAHLVVQDFPVIEHLVVHIVRSRSAHIGAHLDLLQRAGFVGVEVTRHHAPDLEERESLLGSFLEKLRADFQRNETLQSEEGEMLAKHANLAVGVQSGDVREAVLREGLLGLRERQPLEIATGERGRQAHPMINGNEPVRTALDNEDISHVTVIVQ